MNTFESKGSQEPSQPMQEVKISIKRFRSHRGPGTELVEAEVRKIAGPEFLNSIHKLMLQIIR
jgi:hypothetical protein